MLRLTLAAGHYDRTEALRDGRVRAEGIDLISGLGELVAGRTAQEFTSRADVDFSFVLK